MIHTFGTWILIRRETLEISRAELADQVGISAHQMRLIETNKRKPSAALKFLIKCKLQDRASLAELIRQNLPKASEDGEAFVNRIASVIIQNGWVKD